METLQSDTFDPIIYGLTGECTTNIGCIVVGVYNSKAGVAGLDEFCYTL